MLLGPVFSRSLTYAWQAAGLFVCLFVFVFNLLLKLHCMGVFQVEALVILPGPKTDDLSVLAPLLAPRPGFGC